MNNRIALDEEWLDGVNGGKITYTWDGTSGTIGIDGTNPFILVDKDGFITYWKSVAGTMTDCQILRNLIQMGYARKA